ncbi:ABC transporter permease [Niallia oryzisoli]|uniref:ABC transporter permease n=1 Tax=Niallia oryzisoli TaxID=1737571 RepID=UPI003736B455
MNTTLANWKNELEKLLAKKVTKLFLTMAIVFPSLFKLIVSRLFITNWMDLPAENINFTLLDLFITVFLPLFIFIEATDLFTGEEERGTLLPVRPISRIELFLSKTMAIGFLTLIQLLSVWVSVIISSGLIDKSLEITKIFASLGVFLLSWVPLMVITVMAVMIALIIRSSILAISSMIVLYLFMIFIPYITPNLLYVLPVSYLDWYMQWLGNMSIRSIFQSVTYLCSAFTLFFTLGYYMFSKKEA